MPVTELPPAEPNPAPNRPFQGLLAAFRAFSSVMGAAGIGLVGGLAYGGLLASQGVPGKQDGLSSLVGLFAMLIYGASGFVGGLAVGLVGMLLTWILRLAKHLNSSR